MSTKQVTLFGGTGLIGGFLLDLLLADQTISKVRVVTRKPLVKQHDKMEVFEIDFSNVHILSPKVLYLTQTGFDISFHIVF